MTMTIKMIYSAKELNVLPGFSNYFSYQLRRTVSSEVLSIFYTHSLLDRVTPSARACYSLCGGLVGGSWTKNVV